MYLSGGTKSPASGWRGFLIGSLNVGKFLEVVLDAQLVHGFVDHADIVAEYPQ